MVHACASCLHDLDSLLANVGVGFADPLLCGVDLHKFTCKYLFSDLNASIFMVTHITSGMLMQS